MTDRLHLGYFGAYGSGFAETVAFDRLSFESTLFDQYYTNTLDRKALYDAFWSGMDPAEKNAPGSESLPELFARAGYRTIFLTDCGSFLPDSPETTRFETVERLDLSKRTEPCETVEETRFYALFARAAELALESSREDRPFFLWAHLSGFESEWDFPLELRRLFVEDEEDPEPYSGVEVPFLELTPAAGRGGEKTIEHAEQREASLAAASEEEPDFDVLQAVAETYAAGISVWDRSLEELTGVLKSAGIFEQTLLLLGSTRGFPMGEHSRVGIPSADTPSEARRPLFHAEELHQPLLIHFPDASGASAARTPAICGPLEIFRLLRFYAGEPDVKTLNAEEMTLFDLAVGRVDSLRDSMLIVERDAESALRGVITPEWFLIRRPVENDAQFAMELYVRPDDRWDVNEVAPRCETAVNELLPLLFSAD